MPELSIIVPVYKVENYLPRCIESILAQTFTDFELILIDDGSPDRCGEICDEYAAKDSRIVVIHQKNQGVSAARNAGLDAARGTYLGFVDSDDWIEPEMYQEMLHAAKSKGVDLVICGLNHYDESGNFLFSELNEAIECDGQALLLSLFSMPNKLGGCIFNKLYLRETVCKPRFFSSIQYAEDRMYLFNCYQSIRSAIKLPQSFYDVLEREGSATHKSDPSVPKKMIAGSYQLYQMALAHAKPVANQALDKLLDDYLVHVPKLRCILRQSGRNPFFEVAKYKLKMLRLVCSAVLQKSLPRAKLHGYLLGCLRL